MAVNRIPSATYRLQLSRSFEFRAVNRVLDYLQELGISDLYFSPLFRAREASTHGYDLVSHSEIEPGFSEATEFLELADEIRARGLGILLDVVPNHMGINDPANAWWFDVLENGPLSQYANYFDIEWDWPIETLRGRLLLPVLSDYFGVVLERGDLQVVYERGHLRLTFGSLTFPLAFPTWPSVLELAKSRLPPSAEESLAVSELESIIAQLHNLPSSKETDEVATRERYREQSIAALRLDRLVENSSSLQLALRDALREINGVRGEPASFTLLESLLDAQWYRLAYWQVAADEINYRRFFDVSDLAAIRIELPEVFSQVHALIFELLAANRVTGLRIDHPDGLYDPQQYLERLQQRFSECCQERSGEERTSLYIVVEKILTVGEELPAQWPVAGTTGYELLQSISAVLVDDGGLKALESKYGRLNERRDSPSDVVYESKRQTLHYLMASELSMLTSRMHRIAKRSRRSRDFTFPSLLRALREVIACFPVYRTYIRSQGWDVDAVDQGRIMQAVRLAKRRNPTMSRKIFDFISSVLLLEFPADFDKSQQSQWRDFALRFQQVTGPVTAKGVEDTAFYRHFPLASLNEVGGELAGTPLSISQFHALMQRRLADLPHSLNATATHDTKRGEDTRARLNVLSQVPEQWDHFVQLWESQVIPMLRETDSEPAPSAHERYLLIQTLVGTWPLGGPSNTDWDIYQQRIREYSIKALREAKVNTSWINPSLEYEEAVSGFLADVLDPARSEHILQTIDDFVTSIVDAGYINSLSQLVLKALVPGVPDFYQGSELWDHSLVDPDNRRNVDYTIRRDLLTELGQRFAADPRLLIEQLASNWPDPQLKLFVTWRLLQLRKSHFDVVTTGEYIPLEVQGTYADHCIAFARRGGGQSILVVVPRLAQRLLDNAGEDRGRGATKHCRLDWRDTRIRLGPEFGRTFVNVLTGERTSIRDFEIEFGGLSMQSLCNPLPIAVLESDQKF